MLYNLNNQSYIYRLLDSIIAVWALHQGHNMVTQLLPYLDPLLMTLHLLYHLLNHAEPILIHGQLYQLVKDWVEYEVNILFLQA